MPKSKCQNHNKRKNQNRVFNPTELRKCSKCKTIYPATPTYFYRNSCNSSGLDCWCKNCKKEYDYSRHKKLNYGLDEKQLNSILKKQSNLCPICGNELGEGYLTHIDHDHQTGRVREILCMQCNCLLGNCREKISILKSAIKYLEKYAED